MKSPSLRRTGIWLVTLVCLITIAFAQRDRITQTVDTYQTAPVRGHMNPQARPAFDRGAVDPGFALRGMTLAFRRTAAQQQELDQLLAAQHDSSSPQYRKWLTPEQFAQRFGASSSDLATVRMWLESHGFQVKAVARGGSFIRFDATAAQVRNAFGTEIHHYQVNGVKHYANASEPSLPTNIAPLVLAVGGMHDFAPQPDHIKVPRSRANATPNYDYGSGSHALAPGDLATIYNISPLYTGGFTGTGQKVVVISGSNITTTDLALYRTTFGLGAGSALQIVHPAGADPGIVTSPTDWATEATMDLELAAAVAPDAQLVLESGTNVWNAIQDAVDNARGQVISMSFGTCETLAAPSLGTTLRAAAQQANAQGITLIAASGDSGAAGCDAGAPPAPDTHGASVNLPASIPEVTGVGGTGFNDDTSNWGPSTSQGGTAVGYIPEVVWNETSTLSIAASGGGVSTLFTKPYWQAGTGVPADGQRDVPDVSLAAGAAHAGYVIVMSGIVSTAAGSPYTVGGTSASAPVFAGIVALLNAVKAPTGSGNINTALYQVAGGTSGSTAFHDISTGDNKVPYCTSPLTCTVPDGNYGFDAGTGYDLATGLGSVDVDQLQQAWPAATATITSLSPASVTAGGAAFTLIVNGSGFVSGAQIVWNSIELTTTFVSATKLTAPITQAMIVSTGMVSVTVLNNDLTVSAPSAFTINPSATITSLAPLSATAAGAAFTLTVNGTGFVTGAQVVWNSTQLTTTFVSASKLTAPITQAMIATPGSASVTVLNADTTTSAPKTFTINPPTPTITGLNPLSAAAGDVGFTLTVSGTNFFSSSTVMWGTTALTTTYGSPTSLTADVTAAQIATAGTANITVSNSISAHSGVSTFTISGSKITSLNPATAVAGSAAFNLTIAGTGFLSSSTVMWGTTALTTTYVSPTSLTAAVTTTQLASAGPGSVTVKTGNASSPAATFTVSAPKITSLSPATAVAGGAAFALTVTGTAFLSTSTVMWGTTALTTAYVSPTSLTAAVTTTQIASSGLASITVKNTSTASSAAFTFTIVPGITSLTPATAVAGDAAVTTLTIAGTGFDSGSTVMWGATALTTTFGSATSLTAAVTATQLASAGTVKVTVKSTNSGSSAASTFTVSAPAITTLSPATAVAGGAAFTLTVTGTGFLSGSTVMWGTTALTTTYGSATSLTAAVTTTQIASAGTARVTVKNTSTASSAAATFTIGAAKITSLAPATIAAGDAPFTLTVTGSDFISGSTVVWGTTSLTTTYVSATSLTAAVTATEIATAGAAKVTVLTGGTSSAAVTFTVNSPKITSLTPATALAGGNAFTLTVAGTGFVSGSTVMWGTTALTTTYGSATSLTAAVTTAQLASSGTAAITVKNTSTASSVASTFTIAATITSLTPSTAVAGDAAVTTLTVAGTGFVSGSMVMWGATALTTTFGSATSLTAAITATQLASAGTANITVKTGTASSAASAFTITAPTITTLSPNAGVAGDAAFTLTVTGTGFLSGSKVVWASSELTTTYGSATSLTAAVTTTQLASVGTAKVSVKNTATASSAGSTFTINAPKITTLAPATATAGGAAFTITVTGTGFLSGSKVVWGTTQLVTTYVSATSLTAAVTTTQLASAGTAKVTVTNTGTVVSAASTFTVNAPSITSFDRTSIAAGSNGFTLTVNGSNFVSGSTVVWGTISLTTTYVSATQLTAAVTTADIAYAGTEPVYVFNPGGSASRTSPFVVTAH